MVFKNDAFTVGIGAQSVLFEVNDSYPGWSVYHPFISGVISDLGRELGEAKVTRCGVRYASIFPGFTKMSDALVFKIEDGLSDYRRVNDFVRTAFLIEDDIQLLLQIGENVQAHQRGRGDRVGLYMDIDASMS
ncbi:MAG: hypothetical protein OHK0039_46570 [Bacteroidia bacterium]